MTTTPTTGDLRAVYEAIAAVLRDLHRDHSGHPNSTSEAEALLPVVASYGRACAATARADTWETAAAMLTEPMSGDFRARAARLRADTLQATP